jgi:hypothetical protein
MISITLQAPDMYAVAKAIAKGNTEYSHPVPTDQDIGTAYNAVCCLPFLYCPMYLIRETQALRDKDKQ